MIKKNVLLSIIIPTRNRQYYAEKVVLEMLKNSFEDYEIVIQDNSDNDKLQQVFSEINDSRLKYFYDEEKLSFVDNFDKALKNSNGEYIIFLGDDDCVLPNIFEVVKKAKKNKVDAIKPSLNYVYYWPGSGVYKENDNGNLYVIDSKNKEYFSNPKKELIKFLNNGCLDYLKFDMAKIYHGVISRKKIDEIFYDKKKYFDGLTPDMYMSVTLSQFIDKNLCLEYPISVSGICGNSGSSDSATGRHTGDLKNAPHFRGHINYKWNENVPKFYSVETIWAETALTSIESFNGNLNKYFNAYNLLKRLKYLYPDYEAEVKSFKEKHYTKYKFNFERIKYLSNKVSQSIPRMRNFISYKLKNKTTENNYPDISYVVNYFEENKRGFLDAGNYKKNKK
ncbi:glycosyltransferase family 2 protein [Vagococcus fluvialis]|uniref:glycosyltransferase family 2 protein n=1 Tax=Vagococcus fluvialis TaxID=2738 RepID=UPI001D0A4047|nr:glycosyltransferase family 2 protein [Vagococcus fluvialis]UDM78974.1 glycosyltransferase [Vagococcus fluvialis]